MANVKNEDLPEYLQKWVRIRRGDMEHFGLVVGRGDSVFATSPTSVTRPWVLRTQDGDIHFVPDDQWVVEFIHDDAV